MTTTTFLPLSMTQALPGLSPSVKWRVRAQAGVLESRAFDGRRDVRGAVVLNGWLSRVWARFAVEIAVAATVFGCCAYFFQGGGWNQNSHYATTVALVERGTVLLDDVRASTGDLSSVGEHVTSNKAIGTSLAAIPAFLVAKVVTLPFANRGNQIIVQAYVTSLFTAGSALTALAVLLYHLLRRRLDAADAALVALATCLATPLFPNSTMLTSHPLVSLAAVGAFALLSRVEGLSVAPGAPLLVGAGVLAALPTTMEYLTALILLPFGLYALAIVRPRRRVLWFGLGVVLVALIPLTHHTLTFGHPFKTGYASLVTPAFAQAHNQGWYGFDGFSLVRLYQLTFGPARGFFLLSPFLLAGLPGVIRLVRDRSTRLTGLVTGGVAWLVLLTVASFIHWHSGSATGSRYALLFVTFSTFGVAAMMPRHRGWILAGMVLGFAFMLLGTSVTAIPPPPPERGELPNVIAWWWERFSAGNLASWQQAVLVETGTGAGSPTLPFAFNLGQLIGFSGLAALVPLGLYLGGMAWLLNRALSRARLVSPSSSSLAPE
jgi:hypothetical protein